MKNLRKFFVGLCFALLSTFSFYSCLQDSDLNEQTADDSTQIELIQLDQASLKASDQIVIHDKVNLSQSLVSYGLIDQKEILLESYVEQSFKGLTYLITKTEQESGRFQTMVHPITIDPSGKNIMAQPVVSTGCSSDSCSDCQPKFAPSGAIARCDCKDEGESCTHTVCRTKDGRKDCCTSKGDCQECTLYLKGGEFSRCACDEDEGECGHSVTVSP